MTPTRDQEDWKSETGLGHSSFLKNEEQRDSVE